MDHLDTTRTIQDSDANRFSGALRRLVVAPRDPTKGGPWPLIKKVQIFCNADVLATGAVLVDLPGTGDSNKARNRVAEDYMSKCELHWVVAPIDRIVDSESVRGTSFQRKALLNFNSVHLLDLLNKSLKPRSLSTTSVCYVSLTCTNYTLFFLLPSLSTLDGTL